MLYYNLNQDHNLSNDLVIQFKEKYKTITLYKRKDLDKTYTLDDKLKVILIINFKETNKRVHIIYNKILKMINLNFSLKDIENYIINLNRNYYNILNILEK